MTIRKFSTASVSIGSKESSIYKNIWDGSVHYLVVGGGGSGGGNHGGGGGAGGFRTSYQTSGANSAAETKKTLVKNTLYLITVGLGAEKYYGSTNKKGHYGNSSFFDNIESVGGGGGLNWGQDGTQSLDRGSGSTISTASTGVANQLFAGGIAVGAYPGGGGGAGGVGRNGAQDAACTGGYGGSGLASTITGSTIYYSGGGGGGGHSPCNGVYGEGGLGGIGGGGAGGRFYGAEASSLTGNDATVNTGGGGGGAGKTILNDNTTRIKNAAGSTNNYGGAGGSGVVILRWTGETVLSIKGALSYDSIQTIGSDYYIKFTDGTGYVLFS